LVIIFKFISWHEEIVHIFVTYREKEGDLHTLKLESLFVQFLGSFIINYDHTGNKSNTVVHQQKGLVPDSE